MSAAACVQHAAGFCVAFLQQQTPTHSMMIIVFSVCLCPCFTFQMLIFSAVTCAWSGSLALFLSL